MNKNENNNNFAIDLGLLKVNEELNKFWIIQKGNKDSNLNLSKDKKVKEELELEHGFFSKENIITKNINDINEKNKESIKNKIKKEN